MSGGNPNYIEPASRVQAVKKKAASLLKDLPAGEAVVVKANRKGLLYHIPLQSRMVTHTVQNRVKAVSMTDRLQACESRTRSFDSRLVSDKRDFLDVLPAIFELERHHLDRKGRFCHFRNEIAGPGGRAIKHHVCRCCGMCALRLAGVPGDDERFCYACLGYNNVPEFYFHSGCVTCCQGAKYLDEHVRKFNVTPGDHRRNPPLPPKHESTHLDFDYVGQKWSRVSVPVYVMDDVVDASGYEPLGEFSHDLSKALTNHKGWIVQCSSAYTIGASGAVEVNGGDCDDTAVVSIGRYMAEPSLWFTNRCGSDTVGLADQLRYIAPRTESTGSARFNINVKPATPPSDHVAVQARGLVDGRLATGTIDKGLVLWDSEIGKDILIRPFGTDSWDVNPMADVTHLESVALAVRRATSSLADGRLAGHLEKAVRRPLQNKELALIAHASLAVAPRNWRHVFGKIIKNSRQLDTFLEGLAVMHDLEEAENFPTNLVASVSASGKHKRLFGSSVTAKVGLYRGTEDVAILHGTPGGTVMLPMIVTSTAMDDVVMSHWHGAAPDEVKTALGGSSGAGVMQGGQLVGSLMCHVAWAGENPYDENVAEVTGAGGRGGSGTTVQSVLHVTSDEGWQSLDYIFGGGLHNVLVLLCLFLVSLRPQAMTDDNIWVISVGVLFGLFRMSMSAIEHKSGAVNIAGLVNAPTFVQRLEAIFYFAVGLATCFGYGYDNAPAYVGVLAIIQLLAASSQCLCTLSKRMPPASAIRFTTGTTKYIMLLCVACVLAVSQVGALDVAMAGQAAEPQGAAVTEVSLDFGPCSVTCGQGTQVALIESSGVITTLTRVCSLPPCEDIWSDWSDCVDGHKKRFKIAKHEDKPVQIVQVSLCDSSVPKPAIAAAASLALTELAETYVASATADDCKSIKGQFYWLRDRLPSHYSSLIDTQIGVLSDKATTHKWKCGTEAKHIKPGLMAQVVLAKLAILGQYSYSDDDTARDPERKQAAAWWRAAAAYGPGLLDYISESTEGLRESEWWRWLSRGTRKITRDAGAEDLVSTAYDSLYRHGIIIEDYRATVKVGPDSKIRRGSGRKLFTVCPDLKREYGDTNKEWPHAIFPLAVSSAVKQPGLSLESAKQLHAMREHYIIKRQVRSTGKELAEYVHGFVEHPMCCRYEWPHPNNGTEVIPVSVVKQCMEQGRYRAVQRWMASVNSDADDKLEAWQECASFGLHKHPGSTKDCTGVSEDTSWGRYEL